MQSEAAILWEPNRAWSVETIELDPPKDGEVLVRLSASGMCHTDEHLKTGDIPSAYPIIGGHEGAGVVEEVGAGVVDLRPGDHVVFGFLPSCGKCPMCLKGRANLCDSGASILEGLQQDGTSRHHARGRELAAMMCIGTFARHSVVNQLSLVKIPDDVPLECACLVGCGIPTGWGSAVRVADVGPGENVAVIGIGGIGTAAIQGARLAGAERIFAVDPVELKRQLAPNFGATHTCSSIEEAFAAIQDETSGRMCDKVICAMGVGQGALIASIMALVGKGGRVVVTNSHPFSETDVKLSLSDLTFFEKSLVGTVLGSGNWKHDIPKLLELAKRGQLDLEGMITNRYKLSQVNEGYQDMLDGKNIRGILVYDD